MLDLDHLYGFLGNLRADTKERGQISLTRDNLLGTQRHFLDQIGKGLDEGVHHFVVLKGRQAGITTIMMALNLYWAFRHSGIGQTLVMHDEPTRDMLRQTLMMYYGSLPPAWRKRMMQSNRNQMVFKNRSRMMYQIASAKSKGFGRGKAINYMHATEAAFWQNVDGIQSLENSFSQSNPNRLYVYESTANGYNHYHDMWEMAQRATTSRAIFIPWWVNQLYQFGADTPQYKTYWDGHPNSDEREWLRDVKRLYKMTLTGEQMAWWRWMLNEKVMDHQVLLQEHPPTENYAFQMSGSKFFSSGALNDAFHIARKRKCEYYKVHFGLRFEETKLVKCGKEIANLRIWEQPAPAKSKAYYAIGADPAYGSSDWADQFCIQVFRVYADGMDQVAEFCTPSITTSNFAWMIAFLGGAYGEGGSAELNLEVTGPGQAVLQELENMRRQAISTSSIEDKSLYNVVRHMRYYNYKRIDSSSGGVGAIGWMTTQQTKQRMMNAMRDQFQRGMIRIYSPEAIEEMRAVVQDGAQIQAMGRDKDDRVIAVALATIAWLDKMRMGLMQARLNRPTVTDLEDGDRPEPSAAASTANRAVGRFLVAKGLAK